MVYYLHNKVGTLTLSLSLNIKGEGDYILENSKIFFHSDRER
jgi:hypothetical protein